MTTTIPPFGSHSVQVRFKPKAEGVRTGDLSFTSNAVGSPHTILLTGTGYEKEIDPPDPVSSLTYLSAVGSVLHTDKGTGDAIALRSINWYGFEQLFIPSGAWTRPFRTKLVSGVLREGMLDEIKRLGFNSIRLLVSQDVTWPGAKPETRFGYWNTTYIDPSLNGEFLVDPVPQNPQSVKTTLEIMDIFLKWCEELELRVIFDMHTLAPDGDNVLATNGKWYTTTTPTTAGSTTGARREPRNEAQAIAAHVFLAERYKNRPVVCGFDLINEPHNCTWDRDPLTGIIGFYERAGAAIQAVNPDVLIVCEGITGNVNQTPAGHENDPESQQGLYTWSTWWSGKLDGAKASPVQLTVPNKLVYSPHEYGAYLLGVTMQPWFNPEAKVGAGYAGLPYPQNMAEVWRRQWGYLAEENIAPVWIGEFGSYLRIGGNPETGGGAEYSAIHLAKDKDWLINLSAYCDLHSISFAYWAWPPGGDPDGLLAQNAQGAWTSAQQFKVDYLTPFITPTKQAEIVAYPSTIAFGTKEIGEKYTLPLELHNTGTEPVNVALVSATGAFIYTPTQAVVPAAGASTITVTLDAKAVGSLNDQLSVHFGVGSKITVPVLATVEKTEVPPDEVIHIDLPANAFGITAVGDSLTEGGVYFHNGWLAQACFHGNQYLRDRANFAVSGSTVEQAQSLQLPKVLAMNPPPKMCVVATGTNSIYTGTAAVAKVKEICQALITAKIYPVLWTLPPRNDILDMDANMTAWNNMIKAYGKETGIPVLDAFEAMRVPGSMRAREELMNPDGLHFSNYGYTELGRYAVRTNAFKAAPTDGAIALSTKAGLPNLVQNPLFSGSGQAATGFQLANGFRGQLVTGTVGNWQRIIRPIGLTGDNVSSSMDLVPTPVGKKITLACKVRWNTAGMRGGVDKVNAAWEFGIQTMFTDQNWGYYQNSLALLVGPQGDDVEEGTVYMQLTPPAGANRLAVQFFGLSKDILASTVEVSFDVSQLTIVEGDFPFNTTDPSPSQVVVG